MYWIYLTLFVCIIFTPELVGDGAWFFREEDLESLLIFAFGLIGLILYLGKESALLRVIREKLSLQQESNNIRRDLAQSYGYIGEMNRQLEILKNMIVESPHSAQELVAGNPAKVYEPVFDAALLLAQSDMAAVCFIDEATKRLVATYQSKILGEKEVSLQLEGPALIEARKYWWQEGNYYYVRSNESVYGIAAFLIFRSEKNHIEDVGIFQILVTHALLLFSLSQVHAPKETS